MYVAVLSVVMTSALSRPLWPAAGGRHFYICHIKGGVSNCYKITVYKHSSGTYIKRYFSNYIHSKGCSVL